MCAESLVFPKIMFFCPKMMLFQNNFNTFAPANDHFS